MRIPDAVFLDRDGTIIEDAHYIKSPDQVQLIPGAASAVRRINLANVPVIVVTNQSGITRGIFTVEEYEAVRDRFESLLTAEGAHIDASYYCPHHPSVTGPCDCRKPGTKLFEDAMRDLGIEPRNVAYIGDRWRDVAASKALGGRGVLVPSAMTSKDDLRRVNENSIEIARTLGAAVEMLFGLTDQGGAE